MSDQPDEDPNGLVEIYGRVRRQDKAWLKAWADERGISLAIALSFAVTPGIEHIKTWGAD